MLRRPIASTAYLHTSISRPQTHFTAVLSPIPVRPRTVRSIRSSASFPPRARGHRTLKSGTTLTAIFAGFVIVTTSFFAWEASTSGQEDTEKVSLPPSYQPHTTEGPVDPFAMPVPGNPPSQIAPGRPGNLTDEQESKLKELWIEIGKLTGQYPEGTRVSLDGRPTSPSASGTATPDDNASTQGSVKEKKKRRFGSMLGRHKKDEDEGGATEDIADKHGSNKEFRAAVQNMTQTEIRDALWSFCKCDDPDANLCRYLRARKWNVHDALVMLISTVHWRVRVMKLDSDVMAHGEEAALRASRGETQGTGGMSKKLGEDMIQQLKMGKSFLHGCDKEGRPLCIVRVRLHKGGEQSEESLDRLTVYMIETARFMLRPPVDTAVIIFDMTGFSLANMDYTPVKFMIKVFEANYPESLGAVLVHKAPWVFQGIWSIIKGWLDPVVASKITFTKDVHDMEKLIDIRNIPTELGGQEDFEYKYVPPVEGENAQMQDAQARGEIQEEREALLRQFEQNTEDWCLGNRPEAEVKAQRHKISQQLHDNYWQLDPFVRSRSMYDRTGVLQEGGKVDMYPSTDWRPRHVKSPELKVPEVDGVNKTRNGEQAGFAAAGAGAGAGAGAASAVGPAAGLSADKADAKSLRSVKSVYYDAQDELD